MALGRSTAPTALSPDPAPVPAPAPQVRRRRHGVVDKLVRTYKVEDINTAFADSASGATVKPVIVF